MGSNTRDGFRNAVKLRLDTAVQRVGKEPAKVGFGVLADEVHAPLAQALDRP